MTSTGTGWVILRTEQGKEQAVADQVSRMAGIRTWVATELRCTRPRGPVTERMELKEASILPRRAFAAPNSGSGADFGMVRYCDGVEVTIDLQPAVIGFAEMQLFMDEVHDHNLGVRKQFEQRKMAVVKRRWQRMPDALAALKMQLGGRA